MKRAVLIKGLAALLAILLAVIGVVSLSAYRSLDRDLAHTRSTAALPLFSQQTGSAQTVTMSLVDANGMHFPYTCSRLRRHAWQRRLAAWLS